MKPIWLVAGIVLLLAGCGIEPNLVSLDVSPATATLCGVQSQVQFMASGIFIHPYSQRDLTTQVTWTSDSQRVADFVAVCSDTHDVCQQSLLGLAPATCTAPATCILVPGLLTAGAAGSGQVSASMSRGDSGKFIAGNASVDVTQLPCGGGNPPLSLSSVGLSPTSVTGGSSSTGTVTLSGAAPVGGAAVTLSSSNTVAATVASVTVAAGTTSATFTVTTSAVSSSTAVTISGTFNGGTQTATLTVNP